MKKNLLHISLIITLFAFSGLRAQLSSYSNKIPVSINNGALTCAFNIQIKLVLNTQILIAQNKMAISGNDIRFAKNCEGTGLLNYWIESGINTASTVIWVKLDTLAANSSSKIYLFSGNPSAAAVSSIPLTFDFAGSSTDSVASGNAGGVVNCQRGFKFSPNVDILITKLGKMEPDGTTRYITLFDNITQAIITQQQVSGPADQYSYVNLPNPIWLRQGAAYNIQMYQGAGDGYYFGTSSQVDSRLTFYDMRYCNNCTQNTFPTDSLSNYQYGYPDMEFYFRNHVSPEPTCTVDTLVSIQPIITGPGEICSGQNAVLFASGATAYFWSTGVTSTSISISPTVTTCYTLCAGAPGDCLNYTVKTVSVMPLPVLSIAVSHSVLCKGETTQLKGAGAVSYTWSSGITDGITFAPDITRTYTLNATGTNGCNNSKTQLVKVNNLPVIELSTSDSLVCSGETVTLSAIGASSYSWNNGQTSEKIAIIPFTSTMYTVDGVDENGCESGATIFQKVSECTGIERISEAGKTAIRIYPNPNNGLFNVSTDSEISLVLRNELGQVLQTVDLTTDNAHTASITIEKTGVYFVSGISAGMAFRQKVCVVR